MPEDGSAGIAQRFCLLVVAGPDTGATFTSTGERAVIGTKESADLVLHDSTVSRFHCEIVAQCGGPAMLRDLGSLNGTSLNGVGVLAARLQSGATLTLGRTQLRFDAGSETVKLPPPERSLERAAAGEGPVLVEHPTPAAARAAAEDIHARGARARGPFVVVDCAALPAELLDSALFGDAQAAGAFEDAAGGTLYLAEIGELPLELQPKLLRALDRREIKRGGATLAIDVRVVAGTSRNLRIDVNAKKLRSDLYQRLGATEVRPPPGDPGAAAPAGDALEVALRGREHDWLGALLERHGGDEDASAHAAAVDANDFARLLRRHGLR